ncbi:Rossmann-like and DUF2520 domain-containing protein [Schaalia sp. lx-260]|uniref:Rossmann-like and DUF2520 domain-containing protein n=1 Tax=Schaalia sp. lx-260 TaxID=2899082 RepID=UPI001E33ED32|nr:DUF2520 domain-containing protein [Schaalia sp. lx-260]MCD4549911.1 DUF2520 domain-containing protein [Schaalia sp. lx-260]
MTRIENPNRLGVGVIGMGHVGPVIASALRAAGHSIIGVSASSEASRERAQDMLPNIPILAIPDIVERSEVVILAVPDDAIGPLVRGLAELQAWHPGQMVVHLSGAHGISVLEPAARCGAITLAIHPAMTFTGTSIDVSRLVGTPFAVTASMLARPIGHALVLEMGGEPVDVAEKDRALYHAALTHGANFLTTIALQSVELLRLAGIENSGSYVQPLFSAALDRALREGLSAVSGPIPRADSGTITTHTRVLGQAVRAHCDDQENPVISSARDTYTSMTRHTVQMLHDAGRLSDTAADEILAALHEDDLLEGPPELM